jgi:hypothetical protein
VVGGRDQGDFVGGFGRGGVEERQDMAEEVVGCVDAGEVTAQDDDVVLLKRRVSTVLV